MKKKEVKVTKGKTIAKRIRNGIKKIAAGGSKTAGRKNNSSRQKPLRKDKKISLQRESAPLEHRAQAINNFKEQVEVSKFTAVEIPHETVHRYSLPLRYNDNRIVLLARDPWWLHTYWDISEEKINSVISSIPLHERQNSQWTLRVYNVTGVRDFTGNNAKSWFDIGVNFEAYNWYLNVNAPEKEWCVEIGLKSPQGTFYPVARSNITKTPYFGISDIIDEEWALPDDEYYKLLGVYDLGKSSLERRKKITEILREQISSGAFSGQISSLAIQKKKQARKFFLEVATEVIVYGRTEPTADLSVCGKNVRLREDGTFSLRYALPEGDFRFDVVATSQDKQDTIKITPAVKRYTIK
ncbi:MAG: DUF4912 domain-containing protein [Candidatus Omnitrophota bacterium]